MAWLDQFQSALRTPLQPVADLNPHQWSAARVAGSYMLAGLLWIGLSDLTLAGSGGLTASGFLVSTGKGVLFVLLSGLFVFWLCRREFRNTARTMALLRTVVDGTTDAVFVKDREGRYLLVNEAAAQALGRSVDDILGRNDRDLVQTSESERWMANDQAIMAGRVSVTIEETLTSTGMTHTYQATKAPYFDAKGQPAGLVGIGRNVTDRTQVEAALRETDARLREAQRIARLGSWSWEPPTNKVWWSDAEFELFGLDPNAVQPGLESFLALLHPDDRATALARVDSMLAGANEFANDLRVILNDGTCMWIHSQARATRDATGALLRAEGTDQDITAQRLAREAAIESERKLQAAVEVAELGIMLVDYQRQTVELSPRAAEQFGVPPGATISRAELHSRFHPADSDMLIRHIDSALDAAGSGSFALEHRVIRPDGSTRWLNVRKQVSFMNGEPQGAVVVTADVTDRRQAEARLREQEMLVREAAELAKVGGWGFDPVTLQSDWTPEVAHMYGLDPNAAPALSDSLNFFCPEQRPALEVALAAAMQDGVPHDMELRLTAANGVKKWVRTICRPIMDNGKVVRVRGSLQDITDRKRVESELRASEERYRMLFDSNPHPMWVYDVDTLKFLAVNDAAVFAYGYTREEFLSMTIREIRPAEDVPKLEADVARTLRGLSHSAQWKHRRKDGTVFDVEISSHDLPEEHSHSRLVLALDITERVKANEALRLSESRYRQLVDMLPTAVFVLADNQILFGNAAFLQLMGATHIDELLGRSPFEISHPSSHDLLRQCQHDLAPHRKTLAGNEMLVLRGDGRTVPVHVVAAPVDGYGKPATLVALSDLTDRERSAAMLRSVLDSVGDAILTIDASGTVTSANRSTSRLFGYDEADLLGGNVSVLMPEPHRGHHDSYIDNYLQTNVPRVIGVGREVEGQRKDGSLFPAELTITEFVRDGGRAFTGVLRDITARRQLEEQFRQSQKMEAVGRLAGGVAHDFNNLLTVINGYSELLLSASSVDDETREPLAAIHDAGDRAARLTQQLLALSRKSMVAPRLVDLNELVAESAKLFRRLIGEDIALLVLADPEPVRVMIDPGQIEQVLMNLVVNARDAMPTGGRLTIETRSVEIDVRMDQSHPNLLAGHYASLQVTDTGCGISKETLEKIFEPFFTTKPIGQGSGLGLAVVHGVVQQSGGSISVDSVEGKGTCFKILLPATEDKQSESALSESSTSLAGRETVLVVEDEEAVRTLVRLSLEGHGYTVFSAATGREALELLETHHGIVNLVITDVIMPGISGRELAEAARRNCPELRVIYMSGYTDDALGRHGMQATNDQFIQKPFTPLVLVRKVRAILDLP